MEVPLMPRRLIAPPILLSLGFAITATVVAFRPVGDVDIFWQLKLGDVFLDRGTTNITEPFLIHREGVHHDPICWLAQVIFAGVRRLAGGEWRAVRIFDALAFVGALFAVLWPAAKRIADRPAGWVVTVAGGVGFVCALPATTVRPQTLMFLAFGMLIAVLATAWSVRTKAIVAFFVLLFWQNCHPSTGVAAVLVGASAGVGWLRYLFKYRPSPPWAETVISFLAAVVQPLTPAGMSIFPIAQLNRVMCTEVFYINEWYSIFHSENFPWSLHGLVTAFLTAVLVVVRFRRVNWEEAALAFVMFALCIVAIRFTLMLSVAVLPVWLRCLTPKQPALPIQKPNAGWRWFALALAFACPIGLPYVFKPVVHEPLSFPFEGIRKLQQRHVEGTVYVHFMWGGLVSDVGYPAWHVSHDGRYYLHTVPAWFEYLVGKDGHTPLDELFRDFKPVAAILRPGFEDGLIQRLRNDPRYEEIDTNEISVTFVKR